MVILGAGLTGCLAGYAFKNAVIHEYLDTPNTHKALLRFRTDKVSQLTGIPFKKVKVHKGIFYMGEFVQPSLFLSNLYSYKVTGGYYDRSISDISSSVRYVAPANFHELMLNHLDNRISYGSNANLSELKRPVVSTLPLPILASKLGIETPIKKAEKQKPIYVSTREIKNCDMYQTVYFPGNTPIYRASITCNQLIVESVAPVGDTVIDELLTTLGIVSDFNTVTSHYRQEFGKFVPLEEEYRKDLMYKISSEHNIYSLGRHATWRKVLLDDVVQDIDRIESMMKTSAYDRMLGIRK